MRKAKELGLSDSFGKITTVEGGETCADVVEQGAIADAVAASMDASVGGGTIDTDAVAASMDATVGGETSGADVVTASVEAAVVGGTIDAEEEEPDEMIKWMYTGRATKMRGMQVVLAGTGYVNVDGIGKCLVVAVHDDLGKIIVETKVDGIIVRRTIESKNAFVPKGWKQSGGGSPGGASSTSGTPARGGAPGSPSTDKQGDDQMEGSGLVDRDGRTRGEASESTKNARRRTEGGSPTGRAAALFDGASPVDHDSVTVEDVTDGHNNDDEVNGGEQAIEGRGAGAWCVLRMLLAGLMFVGGVSCCMTGQWRGEVASTVGEEARGGGSYGRYDCGDVMGRRWVQMAGGEETVRREGMAGKGWCVGGFGGLDADDIFMLRGRERDDQVRCAGDDCGVRRPSSGELSELVGGACEGEGESVREERGRGEGDVQHSRRRRCHMWCDLGWSDCTRRRDRQLGRQYASQRKRVRWRRQEVWWVSIAAINFLLEIGLGLLIITWWLQGAIKGRGLRSSALLVLCFFAHVVDAASVSAGDETAIQFNAAVIATTMLVATGKWVLTARARDKLAAVRQLIEEYDIGIGAMFELNGSRRALDPVVQWFRAIGYDFKVLVGSRERGEDADSPPRNSMGIFFKKSLYSLDRRNKGTNDDTKAVVCAAERVLRARLLRKGGGSIDVVAVHGKHDDKGFLEQAEAIDGILNGGKTHGLLLGDINRRVCEQHSSGGSALGSGDLEWRRIVGARCGCGGECGRRDAEDEQDSCRCELVTVDAGDLGETHATRRAVRQGKEQWSIIDHAVAFGRERGKWELVDRVWVGMAGESERLLSDHAALIWRSKRECTIVAASARATLPFIRSWSERDVQSFKALARSAMKLLETEGLEANQMLEAVDREMLDAAETVEAERSCRSLRGKMGSAKECLHRWKQLLLTVKAFKDDPDAIRQSSAILHRRSGLRWRVLQGMRLGEPAVVTWEVTVKRCRREIAFEQKRLERERRDERRWLAEAIRAETIQDPLQRAKIAFDAMKDRTPNEKVSRVCIGDDPECGFVEAAQAVLDETGRIGDIAQEAYACDNAPPTGAFEAMLEHFLTPFETLRAPDGGAFDLEELITFELFEDELFRYPRHKSVGAKVRGAMSSLELLRMLGEDELRQYFKAAKQCVVTRKIPDHWQEMLFVLLKKKHGDQRRLRKRREIALMDQCMKLVFKMVKRVSYERMVGRTAVTNYGWVPGRGALNAALTMDCVLGQARELGHSIFVLYLDLAQFFPAIQRVPRRAAEMFNGLPDDVVLLSRAVFYDMIARFDTAFGLGAEFKIVTGDLMGGVLSPDHARMLLTAISASISAVSSGVKVWGCANKARRAAQVMMADDWVGYQTNEESLQRQWAMWVTYAFASGSPIGVAGLEKTVVTAARCKRGRWVNVQVNLRMPSGEGGMKGLPSRVPQLPFDAAYPHMGILRAISGCRRAFNRKLAGGVARLMQKVAAVRTDRTQHVLCANALKGAYVGYYVATVGVSSSGADRLEAVWRKVFNRRFGRKRDAPRAGLYGGVKGQCGDSLCGRHVLVDAVAAVRTVCFRALSCAQDTEERAWARSALARRCRRWGCTGDPCEWLGSEEHVRSASMIEEELDKSKERVEVFDYYILYEAWLQRMETVQRKADADACHARAPRRYALRFEDEDGVRDKADTFGEALRGGVHPAWDNGTTPTLASVLRFAVPAGLAAAGVSRVEHLSCFGHEGLEWRSFEELATEFKFVDSKAMRLERRKVLRELHGRVVPSVPTGGGLRPLTAREVWEGTGRIDRTGGASWAVDDAPPRCKTGEDKLIAKLMKGRASDEEVSATEWRGLFGEAFPDITKKGCDEWACGAPDDFDKYNGPRIVTCWPGVGRRGRGDKKEWGGSSQPRVGLSEATKTKVLLAGFRVNADLEVVVSRAREQEERVWAGARGERDDGSLTLTERERGEEAARACEAAVLDWGEIVLGEQGSDGSGPGKMKKIRLTFARMAGFSGLMIAPDACDWMCVLVLKIEWDELVHEEVWRRAVSATEELGSRRIDLDTVKQAARGLMGDGRAAGSEALLVTFDEALLQEVDKVVQRAERGERLPSREELQTAPTIALVEVACGLMRERGAKAVRSSTEVKLGTDECAVHVEASDRQLRQFAALQAEYDIQFAGATDGGRRPDGFGGHLASAAAFDHLGNVFGGRIDEDTVGLSSYHAEMSALLALLRSWPNGARVLICHDARSPIQAMLKFRMSHDNRRGEYLIDDMLDTLLRELERFSVVVFVWGRAHSGIATNEAVDSLATDFLVADYFKVEIDPSRHASMVATAERGQGRWARTLMAMHVTEWLRSYSVDSCWRGADDWAISYSSAMSAAAREALQHAQQKRLLPADSKTYRGRMAELLHVECVCGGGVRDFEHCLFECKLGAMVQWRSTVLYCVECVVEATTKPPTATKPAVPHHQTAMMVRALEGDDVRGDVGRDEAFRWAVGCIVRPDAGGKRAKDLAAEALRMIGNLALDAVKDTRLEKEQAEEVVRKERIEMIFGGKWRELLFVLGPVRLPRAESEGGRGKAGGVKRERRIDRSEHWDIALTEWLAIQKIRHVQIRKWGWRLREVSCEHERCSLMAERIARCVRVDAAIQTCRKRCTSEAARASLARRAKAIHRKFVLRRQQETFAGMMGSAGSQGSVGLAQDSLVVELGVSGHAGRRGTGSRARGKRRLRGARAPGCRRARAKIGRKRVRDSSDDESESEQSSSEGDEAGSGDSEGDGEDGSDSARGSEQRPNKRSAREPAVGDRIRVFFGKERVHGVWFWGMVVARDWAYGSRGGLVHVIDFDVQGWPQEEHDLRYTRWQDEREGREAETEQDREVEREYNADEWLGEMDVEAEVAKEESAEARNGSNRDERSRKRDERGCEQEDGATTSQKKNRSRNVRAELVWDALEEEREIRRKRGWDDTVSQTLVKSRAKVKKRVHDVDALFGQIVEWMDDSDLGRAAGDDLSVVSDMSVVRDLWRKRGRDDEGADDTGSASRDNGTSKR